MKLQQVPTAVLALVAIIAPAQAQQQTQVKVDGNYQVRHRKTYLTGPQ